MKTPLLILLTLSFAFSSSLSPTSAQEHDEGELKGKIAPSYADSSERWTVPLGGGFGRVFNIGSQPINAQLQGFYSVEHPDGGAEWSIRLQVQLLFPR